MLSVAVADGGPAITLDEPFAVEIAVGGEGSNRGFAVCLSLRPNGMESLDVIVATDDLDSSSDTTIVPDVTITLAMLAECLQLEASDVDASMLSSNKFELIVQGGGCCDGKIPLTLRWRDSSGGEAVDFDQHHQDCSSVSFLAMRGAVKSNPLLCSSEQQTKLMCLLKACKGKLWQQSLTTTDALTSIVENLVLIASASSDADIIVDALTLLQEVATNPSGTENVVCASCRTFIPVSDSGAVSAVDRDGKLLPFHSSCLLCAECHSPLSGNDGMTSGVVRNEQPLHHAYLGSPVLPASVSARHVYCGAKVRVRCGSGSGVCICAERSARIGSSTWGVSG